MRELFVIRLAVIMVCLQCDGIVIIRGLIHGSPGTFFVFPLAINEVLMACSERWRL